MPTSERDLWWWWPKPPYWDNLQWETCPCCGGSGVIPAIKPPQPPYITWNDTKIDWTIEEDVVDKEK